MVALSVRTSGSFPAAASGALIGISPIGRAVSELLVDRLRVVEGNGVLGSEQVTGAALDGLTLCSETLGQGGGYGDVGQDIFGPESQIFAFPAHVPRRSPSNLPRRAAT